MVKQKTEKQIDRYNRYGSPQQWLGAVTVGLTSGAVTMYNLVNSKFHADLSNDFKLLDFFRGKKEHLNLQTIYDTKAPDTLKGELIELSEEAIQSALKSPKLEVPSALKRPAVAETTEFLGKLHDAKREFRDFTRRVAHFGLGIESYGVKGATIGTYERLMTFSPTSRFNTIVKSLFAVGGGIGATLMVFNQLNNRDKLNEIDKQTERTDRKLDAVIDKMGVGPDEIKTRLEKKQSLKEAARAEREHNAGKHVPSSSIAAGDRSHARMQRDAAPELGA